MSLSNEDKKWILAQLATLPSHKDLEALAAQTREQIERVETSLLTAFHQRASPMEQRVRS
jgi:hypothetical protein